MLELKLFEASPAWTIEGDALVTFNLSFTRGLELGGIDTTCLPDDALNGLSARLTDVLTRLPANAVARFDSVEAWSAKAMADQYRDGFARDGFWADVADERVCQITASTGSRQRQLYCFVSTAPSLGFNPYNPNLVGKRARKIQDRARELHASKLEEVNRLCETMATGLAGAGIRAEALDGTALFGGMWRIGNPGRAEMAEPSPYRRGFSLRGQLFGCGLVNHLDFFQREGRFHRVVTMKVPPRHVVPTQIIGLQGLPFPHHLAVTLKRLPDPEALGRLEGKRRQGHELDRVLGKVRGEARHAEMPDHALLNRRADADDVVARLSRGEKLFEAAVQVWFSATTHRDLERQTELVLSRFRSCGQAEGAIEELRGRFAFLSMLPGHHSLVGERYFSLLASRAADLLPVYRADRGPAESTALLTTRQGEPVGFHPFDTALPAWNATVAGGTGSGKSFATRMMLLGWLARSGRVVVATRGRDYHRYAELFDGTVNDISLDDQTLALSPFPAAIDPKHLEERLAHLSSVIGVMVTEGHALTREERHLVNRATRRLYESPTGATPTLVDWLAALEGVASDPESRATANRLAKQMRFWLDGPWARAFCTPVTEVGPRLSVWNLESIRDSDVVGVVMALLSGLIAQSIDAGPTVVVLDEVWSFLRSDAGADLVETLYRTVRKQGSGIWTISQSMNDYTGLPASCRSAILNNSPTKLFLAHDGSEVDPVARTFQLNSRERELLASLESVPGVYSELLAFFGSRRQVLKVVPTPLEYWVATSHPKDVEIERFARASRPTWSRAQVLAELARQFPGGAINAELEVA